MKEPFVTLAELIPQTQIIGDMELQAYLASLGPSQRTEYLNSNIASTMAAVEASKSGKYTDVYDQAIGADNNITSAAYYLTRTRDLTDLATAVDNMTLSQYSASSINNGLGLRQNEINEWANLNKLDTLYFFQILFISLSFIGFLCFLLMNNIINNNIFTILCYIIGIFALVVLLLRWRYTRAARHTRYWHKARFPMDTKNSKQGNGPRPVDPPVVTPPSSTCTP
jgi:hypothetical protein